MQEIIPTLWLGSIAALREIGSLDPPTTSCSSVSRSSNNSNSLCNEKDTAIHHWTVISILDSPKLIDLTKTILQDLVSAGRCTHVVWRLSDTCHATFLSTTLESILQQIDDGIDCETKNELINGRSTNKACLVHCAKGVSRSVATCVAYLLSRRYCNTVQEAMDIIRKNGRQPEVSPNLGFLASLRALEQCHGNLSEAIVRWKNHKKTQPTNIVVSDVAIIGSGPSGLVSAKSLLDQGISNIVVLEETSTAGGLWNREKKDPQDSSIAARINVPCIIRHEETGQVIREVPSSSQPVYDNLQLNFPKDMTSFIGHPFPSHIEHFPNAETVASYYQGYGQRFGVDKLTRYRTRVEQCHKEDSTGLWRLHTRHIPTGVTETIHSRRLLVCNGHFRKAFAPYIRGMEHFQGRMLHSSAFTSPLDFSSNETILIIGGGISGADIAGILLKFQKRKETGSKRQTNVIMSVRHWKMSQTVLLPRLQQKYGLVVCPGIDRIEKDGSVHFLDIATTKDNKHKYTNGSWQYPVRPDVILFATGYRYHFPFLDDKMCFATQDGYKMEGLYKRILPVSDVSLAFIGITNVNFSPAIVMEYQARWYSKIVVKDECRSLNKEDMKREVKSRSQDKTQDALALLFPAYCNSLATDIGVSGYWTQLISYRLPIFLKSCYAQANLTASLKVIIASCIVVVPVLGMNGIASMGSKKPE
ncbi:flavin-binding monooxygenase-like protein [Nitzschia inconspicua]|uniref:Flavin-binding monooxygenase-like protein n=1 Tax=Nitzschia inconspicua TaxID=303405 RepID=A0A9K3PRX9_9STRA|nr:flavin-binding monooxygenase-like protein [Nitzschia inconspicua]